MITVYDPPLPPAHSNGVAKLPEVIHDITHSSDIEPFPIYASPPEPVPVDTLTISAGQTNIHISVSWLGGGS
jgi:hypothetical protein